MLVIISFNLMSIYLHVCIGVILCFACARSESVNVVIIKRRALAVTAVSQGSLGYSHVRPVAVCRQTVII